MCSYVASFPAALAHAFIARYSRPGDVVLDPFSGRGTTPLQACAEGRIGVGNDLNPFAYLLGFVLFRITDVLKPWPANWLDRRVGGAFGVMIDDIAAAAYAGAALWLIARWLP